MISYRQYKFVGPFKYHEECDVFWGGRGASEGDEERGKGKGEEMYGRHSTGKRAGIRPGGYVVGHWTVGYNARARS